MERRLGIKINSDHKFYIRLESLNIDENIIELFSKSVI